MTIILAFVARKGGVGKTTFTTNLAAALRRMGLTVLIVESDGQGNASQSVGLEARDDFYNLVLGDMEFADVIREVPEQYAGVKGGLYILSADDGQRVVEEDKQTAIKMYQRFQELRGVYDVVIGDTSPGITEVHSAWYYTADYLILPTLCETHSLTSVGKTLGFIADADLAGRDSGYPAADVLGILPNRYSKGVNNSQYNLGLLNGLYNAFPIYERIRDLAAWETATRQRRSIYNLDIGSDRRLAISAADARKEFKQVVDSVYALTGVMTA